MHQIIILEQMLGTNTDVTDDIIDNCERTLTAMNSLCLLAEADGVLLEDDPDTGTAISGARGGSGAGGLRSRKIVSVATRSAHYEGNALDRADARRALMQWCIAHVTALIELKLYLEHPQWTSVWVHGQRVPPRSGNRFFIPYSDLTPTCAALQGQELAGIPVFQHKRGL